MGIEKLESGRISAAEAEDRMASGMEMKPSQMTEAVADGKLADQARRTFLERRPRVWNIEPTPWLMCEQSRVMRDDVEQRGGPPAEGVDDHLPGVVGLAFDAVERGLVADVGVVFVADADGEVQQVIDDEGEDRRGRRRSSCARTWRPGWWPGARKPCGRRGSGG